MIDVVAVLGAIAAVALLLASLLRGALGRARTRVRAAARGALVVALAVVIVLPLAFRTSRSRSYQLLGEMVRRVETAEPVVALTFDDGPSPEGGDRILDVLETEGVRATFFVMGTDLEQNPEFGRRAVAAGHELGNHTYSHPRMLGLPLGTIRREIERTDSLIRLAGQTGPIHFRAPFTHKLVALPYVLARMDKANISYDIEPETYPEVAAESERIVEHVVERVRPGSIILLHVMYPARAESLEAVPQIIRELKARGFSFVTVSELIARDGDGGD